MRGSSGRPQAGAGAAGGGGASAAAEYHPERMAQLEDIFVFEARMSEHLRHLRSLRARYLTILGLLVAANIYAALYVCSEPPRAAWLSLPWLVHSLPLLVALAALGAYIASGLHHTLLLGPSDFTDRINRVLHTYFLRFTPDTGELRHLNAVPAHPAPLHTLDR